MSKNFRSSPNEVAMYEILQREKKVPNLAYEEFLEAAREVVATIPLEEITPIEEMLSRIEERILARRRTWFIAAFVGAHANWEMK
jgi:hypothetical protein